MKLLISENGKKIFLDEKKKKSDLNTELGIIKINEIREAKNGEIIESHNGNKLLVLETDFQDNFRHFRRGPQIITPKDAGIISAYTSISPGYRVVEAGTGSGAFTCYLANLVKPTGKIFGYEREEKFFEITNYNLEWLGLTEYAEIKNKDVYDTIYETDVDVIVLDLPEPWQAIKNVERSLRPGGYLVCYLPTMNQVLEFVKSLEKSRLKLFKICNVKEEIWQNRPEALRPKTKDFSHTAFLIFSRLTGL